MDQYRDGGRQEKIGITRVAGTIRNLAVEVKSITSVSKLWSGSREIIGYVGVTAVLQTPHHVKGVINLRGQVIPVIDLRAKFGMETTEVTDETCIIVVEITQAGRQLKTGIIVERILTGEKLKERIHKTVLCNDIIDLGKAIPLEPGDTELGKFNS